MALLCCLAPPRGNHVCSVGIEKFMILSWSVGFALCDSIIRFRPAGPCLPLAAPYCLNSVANPAVTNPRGVSLFRLTGSADCSSRSSCLCLCVWSLSLPALPHCVQAPPPAHFSCEPEDGLCPATCICKCRPGYRSPDPACALEASPVYIPQVPVSLVYCTTLYLCPTLCCLCPPLHSNGVCSLALGEFTTSLGFMCISGLHGLEVCLVLQVCLFTIRCFFRLGCMSVLVIG